MKAVIKLIGLGGICLAAIGASICQDQDASVNPQQGVGWGKPRDGFQTRLILTGGQQVERPAGPAAQTVRVYGHGESMGIKIALRNVSGARKAVRVSKPNGWMIGVSSEDKISLDPDQGESELVDLAQDEEKVFDGPTFTFKPANAFADAGILPLMPGLYTVQVPLPFWVRDLDDPSRSTALRAAPAPVAIEVEGRDKFAGGPQVEVTRRNSLAGGVRWGRPVNGLAAGLILRNAASAKVGGAAQFELFIKNITDSPLSFTYSEFQEYDWRPTVQDAAGKGVRVDSVFVSGLRPMKSVTLKAGEAIAIGRPALDIQPVGGPAGSPFAKPVLRAGPGSYTAYEVVSLKPDGPPTCRVHFALVTGKVEFTIQN